LWVLHRIARRLIPHPSRASAKVLRQYHTLAANLRCYEANESARDNNASVDGETK